MSTIFIDRRKSQKDRSLPNRQRFIDRVSESLKKEVRRRLSNRGLTDNSDVEVSVPSKGIGEPRFSHDPGKGEHDYVLPGNEEYVPGDKIRKPNGGGGGRGRAGSQGEGEDDFIFTLSPDEWLSLLVDDLELPDMTKRSRESLTNMVWRRAGFSTAGAPTNLNVEKTMMASLSRRMALKVPKLAEIAELEEELETCADEGRRVVIEERIAELRARANAIGFLDNVDLRYSNFIPTPKPTTQAVMFCVDGETEYLTPAGWRSIRDYGGEKVAQYHSNGHIEFVIPNAYVKNEYNGQFVRVVAQGIDQLLTPEHRVIYRTPYGGLTELTAAELEARHNDTAYGFRGKIITHFRHNGPGLPLTDDEIRLHIAFKADGTYQTEDGNRAQFLFKKQRKAVRLLALLNRLGIEHATSHGDDGRILIYASTKTRIERRFGSEWYGASASQLALIADEVLLWDGYAKRGTFSSVSKDDADYVQFVWGASGFGTNLFVSPPTGYGISPVWVVCRSGYAERSLTSKAPKQIDRVTVEDKHSYCFNVDTGMLLLRRNGRIFVTGNCVMDVSYSMGEREKIIAKKFFLLLKLFLERKYQRFEIVFVRHHESAKECDEETFFHDRASGGTIVSTAHREVNRIVRERFPPSDWNIYVAQASDGDDYDSDNAKVVEELDLLLPNTQYMAYIQIGRDMEHMMFHAGDSGLWDTMTKIAEDNPILNCKKINDESEVIQVFRSLFARVKEAA